MPPKGKLSIPVSFENKDTKMDLLAFMFDGKGNLLQQVPVKNGNAEFAFDGFAQDKQIFFAPAADQRIASVKTASDLMRYKPYQLVLNFDQGGNVIARPIPNSIIGWWWFKHCRVRGQVSKDFSIDGRVINKPLCKARVHVCEIDKVWWWIPRIPDNVITRIPELILKPKIPPIVFRPWPPIDPVGPIIRNPFTLNNFSVSADLMNSVGNAAAGIRPLPINLKETLPILKPEIVQVLKSNNASLIRNVINNNRALFHPFFCLYPWIWPYLYRCSEHVVTYTDSQGRFDVDLRYWGEAKPDVYIWVEYLIDGVWTTVYKPNIPCNTRWDYTCGEDIFVKVRDERVRPVCDSTLPGEAVWVRRVGGSSIRRIQQEDLSINITNGVMGQNIPFRTRGLMSGILGSQHRSPFGTSLALYVKFSMLLPNDTLKYYRWSYQKIAHADMNPTVGAATQLNNEVSKPYYIEYTDATGTHFTTRQHRLGPELAAIGGQTNLYKIPGVSPAALGETDPTAVYTEADTATIYFDTKSLPGDGLYMLKLELFDKNGVEHSKPASIFQVPTVADSGSSENAPPIHISSHGGKFDFQLCIRVDNNKCQAEIPPVKVNNGGVLTSANPCGFLNYGNAALRNLVVGFKAYQENNFADFSFSVVRGNPSINTPASANGMVIGNTARYVRDGAGNYAPPVGGEFTPAELLGTCTKASFAESLSVFSLATDGWRRLDEYDDYRITSFALEP
jgi:hypothetical protein